VASLRWLERRAADFARGLVDTFVRDNRLLPPVLALLALFVFAWVLAGVFIGGSNEQKPVAHRSEFAQADGAAAGSDPAAPEVDNPNVDSYAAYRSKDPFREVIAQLSTTPEGTASVPAEETTAGGGGAPQGRPSGGGKKQAADTDKDGLPDRKEATFGTDPNNPDTDGDGLPDGLDDANGDGIPDGVKSGAKAGPGGRAGGRGGPGRRGDLLDSGGTLSPP
jgi:Bacterial TSP3 repeat